MTETVTNDRTAVAKLRAKNHYPAKSSVNLACRACREIGVAEFLAVLVVLPLDLARVVQPLPLLGDRGNG